MSGDDQVFPRPGRDYQDAANKPIRDVDMKIWSISLILTPAALVLDRWGADSRLVFAAAVAAVVPLAGWVSLATEDLSRRVGAVAGSLLNATFSNAAELIIALFALRAGLVELVKASLVGAIVANILLVMGVSACIGGWFHKRQKFNAAFARNHAGLLLLSSAALLVPTVFHHTRPGIDGSEVSAVSLAVAWVLLAVYGFYLLFTLHTHPLRRPRGKPSEAPHWSWAVALAILLAGVGAIAWLSEILVRHLQAVVEAFRVSPLFLGFIVIPLAGNAAEYALAVSMSVKNRMNLAIGVALVSSIQVALLLAPLLVLLGRWLAEPVSLVFSVLEVTALAVGVLIANMIAVDGETNWFEGAQLLAAYTILLMAFYFV